MPRKLFLAILFGIAGCGSGPPLSSIRPKAFTYGSAGQGTVDLVADGCPVIDSSAVSATLGGRPLTLTVAGGAPFRGSECSSPEWTETTATPADEGETELVIADKSETVSVTFIELTKPPDPQLASNQLIAGQTLHFSLVSKHVEDKLNEVDFRSDTGSTQVWPLDGLVHNSDGSYDLPVPADAPAGLGYLFFKVFSRIATRCQGDVDCTSETLPVQGRNVDTGTELNLTGAVQVRISQ